MRGTTIVLATLILCAGCKRESKEGSGDSQQSARGKVVSSPEGKYEIWFPDAPIEEDAKGQKHVKLLVPEKKGMYLLSVRKFDQPVDLKSNTAELFMTGSRIGLLAGPNKGGKIVSEQKYHFDGKYPAGKFEVESPKLGIYSCLLIHTGTHFYQIIAAGPKDFFENGDAQKYLDSFKLLD